MLAISGGKVSFKDRLRVPIVGVIWRDTIFEKCFVSYSETDPKPDNITSILKNIVEDTYFKEKQIKLVLLFNSILAGLGILDLHSLEKTWNVPILVITEEKPDIIKIEKLLQKLHCEDTYYTVLRKNPAHWIKQVGTRVNFLAIGLNETDALAIIKNLQMVGDIPEPLRIADIIAKAIN